MCTITSKGEINLFFEKIQNTMVLAIQANSATFLDCTFFRILTHLCHLQIYFLNECFFLFFTARNYSNVAMILLHAGADFDLANAQGYTPIHLAAREGLLG